MKIAQVAPLAEAVPPKLYGGTERVVAYLTDALVELGHDVTLFASGDSNTKAVLSPVWPRSLRLDADVKDQLVPMFMQLETVARRAHEFDVIHCHIDYFAFPLLRRLGTPSLTTLHGHLDLPELPALYRLFGDVPVVSISNSQREPLPQANYLATVCTACRKTCSKKATGAADTWPSSVEFLLRRRRMPRFESPRGPACRIKIAAKVDRADREYFTSTIEPLLGQSHVEFIGEIAENQKQEFLGNAAGLLFPIAWREPFGLVMIEAMACGTPVIAFENGSVPEVLEDALTGFIVHDEDQAAASVRRLHTLDRTASGVSLSAASRRSIWRRITSNSMGGWLRRAACRPWHES